MVDQWCNSVRDIFLAHFGPLNGTAYQGIFADLVYTSMATVYTSSDGFFQQGNTSRHETQIISKSLFKHNDSTVLRWPPLLPELNRSHLGCGEMKNLHHGCAADKLAVILWSYPCTNLRGTFPALVEFIVEIINWALKAKGLQANTCRSSSSIQWLFKTTVS